MQRIISVIIVLLACYPLLLKAQSLDEKNFIRYTVSDGLSSNYINCVIQDNYGYIWIGTENGLNRFDGSTFKKFYSDTSRKSLPRDYIVKLKLLDAVQLAVSTQSGIQIINTRTLETKNLIIPADSLKDEFIVNLIKDMTVDRNGNIFILTSTGFYQYDKSLKLAFRYDAVNREIIDKHQVYFGRNMVMIDDSIILISTVRGFYTYNIAHKKMGTIDNSNDAFYQQIAGPKELFRFMHGDNSSFTVQMEGAKELFFYNTAGKEKYKINSSFTTSDKFDWRSKIYKLNDSSFAINEIQKGVYILRHDRRTNSYTILENRCLENYFCSHLFVDKYGLLWIATNKGLLREKRVRAELEKVKVSKEFNPYDRDVLIRNIVTANNKVFAASVGEGLLVFNQDDLKEIKKLDFSKYWPSANSVLVLLPFNNDTVLAGTYGPLIYVNNNDLSHSLLNIPGYTNNIPVNAMFKDSRNNIYVDAGALRYFFFRGSKEKGFRRRDFLNNSFFNVRGANYMVEDPEGNIWFCGAGLSRFNYRLQDFDMLLDSFPAIRSQRKDCTNPVFDKEGNMYFGVADNGFMIYSPTTKKFTQLTRSDGLPDNYPVAVYLHNNKVWIGTESGLANYDIEKKTITSFGLADDLPAEPLTTITFHFDSVNQKMYVGYNNTIVRFNPDKLIKNNVPPEFFIESIKITGAKTIYHPKDKFELSYKNNNLVVNLACINFEDAYLQEFAYRLVNDGTEEWEEAGFQRNIIFSNLSPGEHKLQVKVFIRNNSWPEQIKEITIFIHPPFWKTALFILILVGLVLTSLYIFYRAHIRRIRRNANIDKQLTELEMKGLHAQMNPHFIFNSLNSIKEMILEDQKQNASRYLSKFAQLIRTNLDQSQQTFITVKQCIDHLNQYLEMEKIRFSDFSYSIKVDDMLPIDEIHITPMLIQPLVENAIWHGLKNKKDDRKLSIRFYKKNEQLVCEIEDNGIGINQSIENKSILRSTHKSVGISNIHERLNVLNEKYKMKCSLVIKDRSELPGNKNGTLAVLYLTI